MTEVKDDWSGATKFKYTGNTGNRFQSLPKPTVTVWGPIQCCQHIDFFAPANPPVGKKSHSLTLNTKLWLQLTTVYGWHWYRTHKRLKNYFKINRRDETYEGGWAKKAVVFPLKTIYKLGTDVKRGEQVGVFGVKKTTIDTYCSMSQSILHHKRRKDRWHVNALTQAMTRVTRCPPCRTPLQLHDIRIKKEAGNELLNLFIVTACWYSD